MLSDKIQAAARDLTAELSHLTFSHPVTHTYNPLEYAWEPYASYLEKFANSKKRVLFLGMNPGPWGMTQTGVPFGEIDAVTNWLKIKAPVSTPETEHPKRPITGFQTTRSEVSGRRLWGMFANRYPDAADFFATHFVTNFCPLVWMADTGRNITPDKLPKSESDPVNHACRKHLTKVIQLLEPEYLIGVGAFAEKQLLATTKENLPTQSFKIGKILHPSPASPIANKHWPQGAIDQLVEQNIWTPHPET